MFCVKSRKLSATITKRTLPEFGSDSTNPSTEHVIVEKKSVTTKDIAKAQRHIDIARSRGIHDADIFTHDLFETSNIFDGDLPAHTDKSSLVSELEFKIEVSGWNKDSVLNEPRAT